MRGYTLLIEAATLEMVGNEQHDTALLDRAMSLYHESAKDEHARRLRGDRPDHIHLTYL